MNTTKATKSQEIDRAHLVILRYGGEVKGVQLRVGDGGPGNTKHFSVKRYCGEAEATKAATKTAKSLGLQIGKPRRGAKLGRIQNNNKTGEAGIQFVWRRYETPVLAVAASWMDPKTGKPKHTSFSVEANGLEGALDKAIAAREKSGVPVTTKTALLRKLRSVYRAGPSE